MLLCIWMPVQYDSSVLEGLMLIRCKRCSNIVSCACSHTHTHIAKSGASHPSAHLWAHFSCTHGTRLYDCCESQEEKLCDGLVITVSFTDNSVLNARGGTGTFTKFLTRVNRSPVDNDREANQQAHVVAALPGSNVKSTHLCRCRRRRRRTRTQEAA